MTDTNKPAGAGATGSGSDVVSAARAPTTPGQTTPASSAGTGASGAGGVGGAATGSGSDTVSAARAATNPGQSSTLASHTSRPLGGQTTSGGTGAQGSELSRHQDRSAGQGGSGVGAAGASGLDAARQAGSQAQERAGQLYSEATSRAREAAEDASEWASHQVQRGSRQLEDARRQGVRTAYQAQHGLERFVNENPVLVGVMGLATGLLIGALLPRTRQEDRTFGRWADEVREQGMRYARDMTQRGREYVEQAFSEEEDGPQGQRDQGRGQGSGQSSGGAQSGGGQRPGPAGRYQNH